MSIEYRGENLHLINHNNINSKNEFMIVFYLMSGKKILKISSSTKIRFILSELLKSSSLYSHMRENSLSIQDLHIVAESVYSFLWFLYHPDDLSLGELSQRTIWTIVFYKTFL